jgi:hypothetical protein
MYGIEPDPLIQVFGCYIQNFNSPIVHEKRIYQSAGSLSSPHLKTATTIYTYTQKNSRETPVQ